MVSEGQAQFQNSPGAKYNNVSRERKGHLSQIQFGDAVNDYKSEYKTIYPMINRRSDARRIVDDDTKRDHRRHHFSLGMEKDFDIPTDNYTSQTGATYKRLAIGPRTPQCLAGKVDHVNLGEDRIHTQDGPQTSYG